MFRNPRPSSSIMEVRKIIEKKVITERKGRISGMNKAQKQPSSLGEVQAPGVMEARNKSVMRALEWRSRQRPDHGVTQPQGKCLHCLLSI